MAVIATIPVVVDDAAKLRFAAELVRTKNPATAAMSIIVGNPGLALKYSYELQVDPIVVAEIERLKDEFGEEAFLPSKAQLAREIYDRANRDGVDHEEYVKLIQLHCSMRGLIEKPGTNVDVNVQVQNVMVVKDLGTDEQWAAKAARQQRELTLDAS